MTTCTCTCAHLEVRPVEVGRGRNEPLEQRAAACGHALRADEARQNARGESALHGRDLAGAELIRGRLPARRSHHLKQARNEQLVER
jgi:hypothetical protein